MDFLEAFQHTLAETIAWCAPRATSLEPESSLRSLPLNSQPSIESQSNDKWKQAVSDIATTRAMFLRDAGNYSQEPPTDLAGGRLLLYAPNETLSDGAAWVSWGGFFDWDNAPPWDTWVAYVEDTPADPEHTNTWFRQHAWKQGIVHPPMRVSYLVSWVPPCLLEVAEAGIEANPEECVEWLADRDTTFTRALQETGLLVSE